MHTKFSFHRSIMLISLILAVAVLPASATSGFKLSDTPYKLVLFETTGSGQLSVETSGGYITVSGSSSSAVKVEMYVRKNGRFLTPEDTDLSNFDITIEQKGSKIIVSARRLHSNSNILTGRSNESVSFKVTVPTNFTADLNTSGGSISINSLNGNQSLKTSGGALNITEIVGNVDAATSGGSVSLKNITGNIDAKTSGGAISATDITGDISLKTSGGSLTLKNVSGKVDGHTSGGSINAAIAQLGSELSLSTSGGSINVNMPAGMGLDLNIRGNRVDVPLENFSGTSENNVISGKMNGGGPLVSLKTSGGTVRVRFE